MRSCPSSATVVRQPLQLALDLPLTDRAAEVDRERGERDIEAPRERDPDYPRAPIAGIVVGAEPPGPAACAQVLADHPGRDQHEHREREHRRALLQPTPRLG